MSRYTTALFLITLLFFVACKPTIKPEQLYGKWKYTRVLNPLANPPDSVSGWELSEKSPYIEFTKNNDLTINWGGSVLSHGKFNLEGRKINYTEALPDGKTRQFPFFVTSLTADKIIFETRGKDGSEVTAVKQ